jgi:serine phosphatase RsbU (regulator of sigma subunit)
VWVPVREGSDVTGVLALTLTDASDEHLGAAEELGLLTGYLIAAQARCTDLYNLYRRRRSMSLAASMQWDLLPPLVLDVGTVALAGLVEPAYDVGGDCFDYAINGNGLDFAVMDALGHDLGSALIASLAMGCYRHGRRDGATLEAMHAALDGAITTRFPDASFVTGVLGRLDLGTGTLTWTNAGHPRPLLVRGEHVVGELDGASSTPWGLGGASATVSTASLEPGDCVVLYTDGLTEARTPDGHEFGVDRLADHVTRAASEQRRPEQIVRLLVEDVRDHRRGDLADDATVVLIRWNGGQHRS